MKIQNNGAVLVQIAPLYISQPRNQNQSIVSPQFQKKRNSVTFRTRPESIPGVREGFVLDKLRSSAAQNLGIPVAYNFQT